MIKLSPPIFNFLAVVLSAILVVFAVISAMDGKSLYACAFTASLILVAILIYGSKINHQQGQERLTALRKINDDLLTLEKSHEDFVKMAAHELKTPLTVLKAYLQMLDLKLNKEKQSVEYFKLVGKMDVQVDKLLDQVSDLLDASQMNSPVINYLMYDFNINELLKDCADGLKAANPDCFIETNLEHSDPLIRGDKERIYQVLNNLISNAIKYSPEEKHVKIHSHVVDGHVIISVKDHGMGIPLEKQKHVFDRFYRANTPSSLKLPGLGLGLFISAEIVKRHHGEIGLESEDGNGSTFWFSLPLKKK